jgi:hypothetical protein
VLGLKACATTLGYSSCLLNTFSRML